MKKLMEDLKHYLEEILALKIKVRLWAKQKELPFFLVDYYEFYEMDLLSQLCLLMVAKEDLEITPTTVQKHVEQVKKKWSGLCIYVHQGISSYNRIRLIKHRVPFIIPGNQMYLPELGMDLREYFKKIAKNNTRILSPATQAIVIYALLQEEPIKFTPSEIAKLLGYTVMTMTRGFDELKAAKIGQVHKQGRERTWSFIGSKKELWEQAKPLMSNPIKTHTWLKQTTSIKKIKVASGLSALSHYSMLNAPFTPIYAISLDAWKNVLKDVILPSSEEAVAELEIWHYNPNLFAVEGCVDPFSLYLTLKDNNDERIESALDEMMEKIKW